jgi:hypothetical protein
VLRRYFLEESFRAQFAASHALTINYTGPEGKLHFVLLNEALSDHWGASPDPVLADEFGHLWLQGLGYEVPPYEPGERSCVATNAADAVQHVLVRREVARRGIPYLDYWVRNLEMALRGMGAGAGAAPPDPPCRKLAQMALWIDVRLGLSPERWPNYAKFQRAMKRNTPEIEAAVDYLEERLRQLAGLAQQGLPEHAAYRAALDEALRKFAEVYAGKP